MRFYGLGRLGSPHRHGWGWLVCILVLFAGACTHHEDPRDTPREKTSEPAPPPLPSAARDPRHVLVVFGDSLAAGFGLEPGQSFPDYLQKKLDAEGAPWRVINLGISGDTTEGGVARIDSAVSLKPEIVVLELGGNDGLRGLPLENTRANLDTMTQAFRKSGARVVLAGMTLPPNYGTAYIQGFEGNFRDLATKYKLTFIPFLLEDAITKDLRYLQHDGIHPTAAGSEIVAGTVLRAVKPLLSR
jgi:acyl-CoA thioesterase-1